MKILVVGGGTAGLISAIILKKHLDFQIDIVRSKKIGIVGVGEGSTEHFKEFMEFANIDQYSLIKECDATYKGGILFESFGSKDFMHSVSESFNGQAGQYSYVYAKQISDNSDYMQPSSLWQNKINSWFINKITEMPFNQFHFNTFKLNNFLTKIAQNIGINFYDDEINDIILNQKGEIDCLIGNKTKYDYDFYIDSTGFKRLLISKLGGRWKSFGQYMKMNSAITFQTEETNEYSLWTLAKAMKYGWMFRLPVQGRYGNGYIYDSNYINLDQAKQEVDIIFNKDIEIGSTFKFDPGAIDNPWIKNCVAIGLSSLFVEPLEATSIGSTIQQSFLLMHRISNYDNKSIDLYNKSFNDIAENIRDFIVLHYMTDRKDTKFWKDVSDLQIPDSLEEKLEVWKNRIPIKEDFVDKSNYCMFKESNFIIVMHGLNMFNVDSIKKEYFSKTHWIKNEADLIIKNQLKNDSELSYISHKKFIKIVKEYI
jgi:flavin-dependent dehydrogenase